MKTELPEHPQPVEPAPAPDTQRITDPNAASLSESGNWAETQVIETIKEATIQHKDPRRALSGKATQVIGSIFHPVVGKHGVLVTPKPSWRRRIRRLIGYLRP